MFQLWQCLVIVLVCATLSDAGYIPKVTYLTIGRNITESLAGTGTGALLPLVSNADDAPFEQIDLPFSFPFFGEDIVRIYASPNGALHLDKYAPCGQSFASGDCDLEDYTGTVGLLVTDFDFSSSDLSNVTVFTNDTEVHITYDTAFEYGEDPATTARVFDFSASLFADGSVVLRYSTVPTMDEVYSWFAGIRPEVPYEDKFVITSEQRSYARTSWFTETLGVYPQRSDVDDGRETVFCPISTTWCLTPSVVYNESWPEEFSFTPLSMSCLSDIEIGYYTTEGSIADATPCILDESEGYPVFKCSNQSVSTPLLAGTLSLNLVWRPATGEGEFQALPFDSFDVVVVSGGAGNSNLYINADVNNCTVNTGACGGLCDLCAHDLECLELPCVVEKISFDNSPLLVPDLYSNYTCDGTCAPVYDEDANNVCCNNEFIDCAGICNGTAVPGLDSAGGDKYVCCLSGLVDCFGRCDGEGTFDTCGICRLPGDEGPLCDTYFTVDTGFDDGIIYEFYSTASSVAYNTFNLTFYNSNTTDVVFSMALYHSDEDYSPTVLLPEEDIIVPGNSSIIIPVRSSITDLLSGNKTLWEAKTIRVLFGRPELFSYLITLDVKLYPDTLKCSAITDRSTCVSLPGCMHCYSNPGYRVLYTLDEACQGNESGINETNRCRRDLFSNVIPSSTNADIGDPTQNGLCLNGWRTTDCGNYEYSRHTSQYKESSVVHIAIGATIFAAVFAGSFYAFSY